MLMENSTLEFNNKTRGEGAHSSEYNWILCKPVLIVLT